MSFIGKLLGTGLSFIPGFGKFAQMGVDAIDGAHDDDGGGGVWDEDGNFTGDSYYPEGGGGSPWMDGLKKYAVPGAVGGIMGLLANRNAGKQRELQRSGLAMQESQLDPFRGVMHQSQDLSRLDMAANGDFTPTPIQLDKKYGAGLDAAAMVKAPYTPSDQTRGVMRNAMDMVANGSGAAPLYNDPKNSGRPLPMARMALPQASAPGVVLSEEERRRRGMSPVDEPNPWLQA